MLTEVKACQPEDAHGLLRIGPELLEELAGDRAPAILGVERLELGQDVLGPLPLGLERPHEGLLLPGSLRGVLAPGEALDPVDPLDLELVDAEVDGPSM